MRPVRLIKSDASKRHAAAHPARHAGRRSGAALDVADLR